MELGPRLLTLSLPEFRMSLPLLQPLQQGEGCRTESVRGGRIRFVAGISLIIPVEKRDGLQKKRPATGKAAHCFARVEYDSTVLFAFFVGR
jgi:hypothetical protein